MSKTIGQQVEEFWSKFHSHSMASAADGDEVTDWLTQTLQERDRIARKEAIKECEGCVPEEKDVSGEGVSDLVYRPAPRDGETVSYTHINYDERRGHNSCREQTLTAINKLRV